MAARIDARVRRLIINSTDQPRRGEVTRFCREHGISRAEFCKVRARARDEGKLAALTPILVAEHFGGVGVGVDAREEGVFRCFTGLHLVEHELHEVEITVRDDLLSDLL